MAIAELVELNVLLLQNCLLFQVLPHDDARSDSSAGTNRKWKPVTRVVIHQLRPCIQITTRSKQVARKPVNFHWHGSATGGRPIVNSSEQHDLQSTIVAGASIQPQPYKDMVRCKDMVRYFNKNKVFEEVSCCANVDAPLVRAGCTADSCVT